MSTGPDDAARGVAPRSVSGKRTLLRPAVAADLGTITAIYNESLADGFSNCDLAEIAASEMENWLQEHSGRYPVFVAEQDSELVGWGCLSPFVSKECFDRTAYTSTYISRRFRGMGVGRKLRQHIINEARILGFHSLVSRIFARNSVSIALTEKLGFQKVAHLPQVIYRQGAYWDVTLYQLILDDPQRCNSALKPVGGSGEWSSIHVRVGY